MPRCLKTKPRGKTLRTEVTGRNPLALPRKQCWSTIDSWRHFFTDENQSPKCLWVRFHLERQRPQKICNKLICKK
jgi:hypothetical protein